jgi:acylphosphatase
MVKHLIIRIRGKVQGVGFNYSAAIKAELLKLYGFIRNDHDGSIYLEIEGEQNALQNFLSWCQQGPIFARVEAVEVNEGLFRNFNRFDVN